MTLGHPANSGTTVDLNPAAAVARRARFDADVVAVRYGTASLTYAELDTRAARLATVLADGGVGPGDRVAYLGLNSPAFLVTMLAAFRLGAIYVPVNFRLAGPELRRVLEASGSVALIAEQGHREAVDAVRDTTALKQLLLVDDDPQAPSQPCHDGDGWLPWSGLLEAARPAGTIATGTVDEPAILMFTSGTTGLPKGVILTHGNAWWNAVNVDTMIDARRGDVTYAAAPLFHIGGLNVFVLRTLQRGGTVAIPRVFDPATALADLVDLQVNSMFAVPAMYAALARTPGFFEADLSALRALVVAGAPVPPSLIREFHEHGLVLQQAWGLTETAPFATHLPAERTLDKLGSAGIPMPYTQVRVVDTVTNTPVPPGTPGEIVVRGPNVTPGYWENPGATAAAFDEEGWFHSGDIGHLDDDGCLFIVDRLKDMIISGGENIYPAEVERALADCPGLVDVAVVGVPDEQWGETVVAVVSVGPDRDRPLTIEELREHAARSVARYKLPTRLTVVEAVPRNASGKLDKRAVRAVVQQD